MASLSNICLAGVAEEHFVPLRSNLPTFEHFFSFYLAVSQLLCNFVPADVRNSLSRRRSTLYPSQRNLENFCYYSKDEDNGIAHSVCTHACGSCRSSSIYGVGVHCCYSFAVRFSRASCEMSKDKSLRFSCIRSPLRKRAESGDL